MPAPDPLKINVRVSGALKSHVEHSVSDGDYENVSEYVRDLIRKDKAAKDDAAFEKVKAHLQAAFAVSDDDYVEISKEDFMARKRAQS